MIYGEKRWNAWLDHLADNTLGESPTTRLRQTPQGQAMDFLPTGVAWEHPWSVSLRWNKNRWEARIKPGTVNAVDPLVPSVASREKGRENTDASLAEDPWIPLHSFRSGLQEESKAVRAFFQPLGVRLDVFTVSALGEFVVVKDERDKNPLPPRQLVACDLYLAKARASFRATVTIVDAGGQSGEQVDYATVYDTSQLERVGPRARVMQAPVFPPVFHPTFFDRFSGNFQDDGEDRTNICSVFFLSPPGHTGALDVSWTPYVRYDLFWNLKHGSVVTPPKKSRRRTVRFSSPLGFGLANNAVNAFTAVSDDMLEQLTNALENTAPEGKFSIA